LKQVVLDNDSIIFLIFLFEKVIKSLHLKACGLTLSLVPVN